MNRRMPAAGRRFLATAGSSGIAGVVLAASAAVAELRVDNPWARPNPPVVTTGAAYLTIHNDGPVRERLVRVNGAVASRIELHQTQQEDGVTKMRRHSEGIDIEPGESVRLEPGGLHIMLIGLKHPLKTGDSFTLELEFDTADVLPVTVEVTRAAH